ncbi:hypothetical protein F7Q99_31365 [Streptomyces kaniharaensis]|uniref:Uncharacterized protein n=1 Tax=Streptomyces kaniharaensis TaxID=212423 RepID=A0A6N7L232_9ACTN|nr:hypothetical protein [Streptomyces kaniharaensis]MQS16568.1 hypothetical protein [Streptomyces kaniharaensis]
MVLAGTGAAQARSVVADPRLAAEENPATAELLATVPAGAARIEDLIQRRNGRTDLAPAQRPGRTAVRVNGAVDGGRERRRGGPRGVARPTAPPG